MIRIEAHIWREMIDYCRGKLPFEACGALFGPNGEHGQAGRERRTERSDGRSIATIRLWTPIANRAANPESSFAFDAADWIASLYEAERKQWKLLGIFHSHPSTPASPSPEDLVRLPAIGSIGYWIVSFGSPACPGVPVYYRLVSGPSGTAELLAQPYVLI